MRPPPCVYEGTGREDSATRKRRSTRRSMRSGRFSMSGVSRMALARGVSIVPLSIKRIVFLGCLDYRAMREHFRLEPDCFG